MKKIALISAAIVVASATAALAATPMTIVNSRHDMRKWISDNTNGTQEICIYCHTPHNAGIEVPLWNRKNPSSNDWKLYNASATLSSAAKNSYISNDSISLFCMSCHDGVTALGAVNNKNPLINAYTGTVNGYAVNTEGSVISNGYAKIGGNANGGYNLANTHPIGFDFVAAQGEDNGLRTKDAIMTKFQADSTKSTPQSFLYARPSVSGAEQKWFECASCHRVHDPGASGNFLRLENSGSQLCLACHDK